MFSYYGLAICHLMLGNLLKGDRRRRAEYLAAVRLYAVGFAAEPKETDPRHLYNAARAAALAGCGSGKDEVPLDDNKVRLRQQARHWLRAILKGYRQVLDRSQGKTDPGIAQRLQHWQRDPDFNGVRETGALGKLPEAEREDWRKLWADVAATLARAQAKGMPKRAKASPAEAPKND